MEVIMKRLFFVALMAALFVAVELAHASLDDFDGPQLSGIWTLRDPASKSAVSFAGGNMVLDLAAGADMYISGVDGGVMFLTDPPDIPDFSVDLKLNVAVDGFQPPACHIGIGFFNEAKWAYTAWGPYSDTDIRLEDCVGADYRWRDQTLIGVDLGDVAIDQDVWLKVVKTGNDLEFFTKGNAGDSWVSGGVDSKLGPNYTSGDYQVGIIAKSWAGSVDSTFEIDFFDIPELSSTPVAPAGKLATTWSEVKK
jgi:hypothetical protein